MMNDGMFDFLLTIMYYGCGAYCVYTYFKQKKAAELLPNKILCPSNGDPKQCKMPKEFMGFMLPKALILGIVLLVFGTLYVLERYVVKGDVWITLTLMGVPLAFLIWYAVMQRKAVKRFWD